MLEWCLIMPTIPNDWPCNLPAGSWQLWMYSTYILKVFFLEKCTNQQIMRVDPRVMPIGIILAAGVLEYSYIFPFSIFIEKNGLLGTNLPHTVFWGRWLQIWCQIFDSRWRIQDGQEGQGTLFLWQIVIHFCLVKHLILVDILILLNVRQLLFQHF